MEKLIMLNYKKAAYSIIFLIFFAISVSGHANTDTAPRLIKIDSRSVGADEIVRNLRAIIDHGDLTDEQFFSEKLDIGLSGGKIETVAEPDFSCGLGMSQSKEKLVEQRFYYSNLPSYFAQWFGRSHVCDFPYVKVFRKDGSIKVISRLVVDTNKICITAGSIRRYFRGVDYSTERGGFRIKYIARQGNPVSVEFSSPSSQPMCSGYINFYQN
ncbi:hypothetical protein F3J16_06740 [Burkholderia sp. Ap-962]|uniref:hypothetical protein n=1 Tax=Burkholderia sp. Ap-962 TaxID=2608333 RepID=UPI00141E2A4D|nr:hypothetical protein [Burkholderia sp. Ap-962]NIF69889.1 hypothetical protein [Burkholderia sp. Ap-962]